MEVGKRFAFRKMGLVSLWVWVWVWVCAWRVEAVTVTVTPSPSPAPAPAPEFLNLTDLLQLAGPFTSFLGLLESTAVLNTIQAQANDTQHGLTLFVPSDPAFSSLKPSTLGNLTAQQKKALVLSHAISDFYTLQDFQNFSNPANTMASGLNGGKYTVNITSKSGAVSLSTGHVTAPITSTVHVTYPVAVYTVSRVLLPVDIFGVASPSPSPSPSPSDAPSDDASPQSEAAAPSGKADANANAKSPQGSSASSIHTPTVFLMLVGAGAVMLL